MVAASPYLPTNAVLGSKHTLLDKSGLPLGRCRVLQCPGKMWGVPLKLHRALWMGAVCISRCLTLLSKVRCPFWKNQCFCLICAVLLAWSIPFKRATCLKLWALLNNVLSLLTSEQHNIVLYGKNILWRSSIPGKLDFFCLTCVLFPLVRSAQPSFRHLSLKEMFSIQSNNSVFVLIKYLTHIKGVLHKFNNRFFKDDHTLSEECYMHTVYHMFKQCLIVLRFKDAHSSNYNMFQKNCLQQRVLFQKYGSLSWKNITLCIQKNDVQLWRTYFTCLHVPCVLHLRNCIVKRALHVQEGSCLT